MVDRFVGIVGVVLFGVVLFVAPASGTTAVFSPSALSSSTGFDNQTLQLPVDFDLGAEWVAAGRPLSGETLPIELTECQFLSDANVPEGGCNEPRNVSGPWMSRVEWSVTNTTGRDDPVFLFFSGLQPFLDPSDPSAPAVEQYAPGEVGLILESADFSVARYRASSDDYYYLGFVIDDLSQPVDLTFDYAVTRDILGMNTSELGTPILQMNAFFLPEPGPGVLTALGMVGLLWLGERRER